VSAFKDRSIISVRDLSREDFDSIIDCAERLEREPQPTLLNGAVMAALFFEPSTRTRLSFESAMLRLGGRVLGFAEAGVSSTKKGESLHDTIKTVEGYVDVVVMRHPIEGSARWAAESCKVPVINAGDGANQHPTQTCLDLYTMRRHCKRLKDLTVGFVGDLRYGRTVHSLSMALSLYGGTQVYIAPPSLRMPSEFRREVQGRGVEVFETESIEEYLPKLDILYVTRIQKERFGDPLEYNRVRGSYLVDCSLLSSGRDDLAVMHPLPRVNELGVDVDDTRHAVYFQQAHNGVVVRQALLAMTLGRMS